ncbi:MAG: hypothetical protein ACRDQ0_03995 [Pseudonocardia sp.]
MTMWPRLRRDTEVIAVTPLTTNGSTRALIEGVGAGHAHAVVIELPSGTHAVRIERVRRQRVDLGRVRTARTAAPRRARPSRHDDSDLWLWWHTVRTEHATRRAHRRHRSR